MVETNGGEGGCVLEVDRYFSLNPCTGVANPHTWWRDNRASYPVLAILARKYLAIPATSVASERVFSFSGNMITDKRTRLSDDAVSDMVFCNYALKCLKMAKEKADQ
jgi:hypothetical protein